MNRKGFTLVELLATLTILGIIAGIVLVSTLGSFNDAKEKTEEIFISTIKDAVNIYLDSDGKNLIYQQQVCSISKTHNSNVLVYKADDITLSDIINSKYHPISNSDLVNPGNEDVECNDADDIKISLYRDEDYVYYYRIKKEDFGCLISSGTISNLPEGC